LIVYRAHQRAETTPPEVQSTNAVPAE
jgi:hypothetical protein